MVHSTICLAATLPSFPADLQLVNQLHHTLGFVVINALDALHESCSTSPGLPHDLVVGLLEGFDFLVGVAAVRDDLRDTLALLNPHQGFRSIHHTFLDRGR